MALKQKIEAGLKRDEYILDAETMPLASIREMVAKGFHPVCKRCGTRLEFALSPSEAKEKKVAPGLRCPKDLRHCQVVVEFPRDANWCETTQQQRLLILVLLWVVLAGCVSKPAARVEAVASVPPDAPLAVGDCLVLKPVHDPLENDGWRATIDADGYFLAPLRIRVKIVDMTTTEAVDAIASEYVRRNILRRAPALEVLRCEEYDRKKQEIELRIKEAKKGKT